MINQIILEQVMLFTCYSFIGWLFETIIKSVRDKQMVNSGFLFGPFCPIYGFGALLITNSMNSFVWIMPVQLASNIFIKILFSIIIATLLEYLVGFLAVKLFNLYLWDYSNEPFNFKGIICLRFSIIWGIFALIMIELLHPLLYQSIHSLKHIELFLMSFIILFYFFVDTFVTILELQKIQELLSKINNNSIGYIIGNIHSYIFYKTFSNFRIKRLNYIKKAKRSLNDKFEYIRKKI